MNSAKRKQALLAQSKRARRMGVQPLRQAVERIERLTFSYMINCAPEGETPDDFEQFNDQISQLRDLQKQMQQIVNALPIPLEAKR
jgi:hypothetical protein